jgi:hypothetical protein
VQLRSAQFNSEIVMRPPELTYPLADSHCIQWVFREYRTPLGYMVSMECFSEDGQEDRAIEKEMIQYNQERAAR